MHFERETSVRSQPSIRSTIRRRATRMEPGERQISCNGVLNKICPDRISPAATNLLALLPEPNSTGYQLKLSDLRPATFDQNQFDTRVDYFVTSKTVIFGKFSYFRRVVLHTPTCLRRGGRRSATGWRRIATRENSTDHDKSLMFDYQHTFSPSLLQGFPLRFFANLHSRVAAGRKIQTRRPWLEFQTLTWVRSTRQACHR